MADTGVIDLGFVPRRWQGEFLSRCKRFSIVVVHRGGGKTVGAVMKLVDAALKAQTVMPRFMYIAPELKQAKRIAWALLKDVALKIPGTRVQETELWIEFPHNAARIRLYGVDDPDKSIRGEHPDGVVLDEVAQMPPGLWEEHLLPALQNRMAWALFIGTPKGTNLFSETYYRGVANPDWYADLYPVTRTGVFTDEQIDELHRSYTSEQKWRQEMMCDFTASSEDALIPIDLVNQACGRHLTPDQYNFAPKVLGCDVARLGDDRTVIQPRQGLAALRPRILLRADNMVVADAIARTHAEWESDAIFVDGSGGYGSGVIDILRRQGFNVFEVQFGGRPFDQRFVNKRIEMWWGTREWLSQGGALPDMPEYRMDLTGPTYNYDNVAGKMQMESKDKIKIRTGTSPDVGDALALTFAAPVSVSGRRRYQMGDLSVFDLTSDVTHSDIEYDPWDRDAKRTGS